MIQHALIFALFQDDIKSEAVDLNIEFILDGSHNKHVMFPVDIYINPTLVVHEDRVDDYVPMWPCSHDYIQIEVRISLIDQLIKIQGSGTLMTILCR